ncbi:MAG: ABC transporter ATP-binding protein [Caldibacillus sp.]
MNDLAILSVKNVTKTFKNHTVLDHVSLTIDEPGIWALVGPNGVGKTTFLNVVTNILPATSGTVELMGRSNKDPAVFKQVSYLQDNRVLFEYLTGYDHLKYLADIHKLPKKRIVEVAEYVGMESYLKKAVGNYSLGMKQHLLLAMALINKPKLLLLDEPLTGLDPTSAILMRKIFLQLVEEGTTILLSSHHLAEIDRVTKQIIFLKNGKLIEVDLNEHEKTYYHFFLSDPESALRQFREQGFSADQIGEKIRIELQPGQLDEVLVLLKNEGLQILDIQKEVTGSEEMYEEIFAVRGSNNENHSV